MSTGARENTGGITIAGTYSRYGRLHPKPTSVVDSSQQNHLLFTLHAAVDFKADGTSRKKIMEKKLAFKHARPCQSVGIRNAAGQGKD